MPQGCPSTVRPGRGRAPVHHCRSAPLSRKWKDSSIPFKMSWMRSARGPAEHSKSPESGKPHQKAADSFSGLRGTSPRQQRRMPARTRGSGHIESVNRLHSASKRMRRCLNQMFRVLMRPSLTLGAIDSKPSALVIKTRGNGRRSPGPPSRDHSHRLLGDGIMWPLRNYHEDSGEKAANRRLARRSVPTGI